MGKYQIHGNQTTNQYLVIRFVSPTYFTINPQHKKKTPPSPASAAGSSGGDAGSVSSVGSAGSVVGASDSVGAGEAAPGQVGMVGCRDSGMENPEIF